ncbi:Tn3 family transposase [Nonomuraea sp. NPDC000554]|uniref:Tn3 family transposase n=1 Tax=Nonomuraea sp. NPDC000554 TaxID=3154259 RepID=UPI00331D86D1
MLSRDSRPTPLGDAIAHYGRAAKALHILRLADEPGCRRRIKAQANLQKGRHALARKMRWAWSSTRSCRSTPATWAQPRTGGCEIRDEDVARLSPFVRHHIYVLGRHSFQLPDLPGALRPLRHKDATDEP